MKDMKTIAVFPSSFCESCGKHGYVVLVPMQYGYGWMDMKCMLKYRFAVWFNKRVGRTVL